MGVRMIPVGPLTAAVLTYLQEGLKRELGASVFMGAELPLPEAAYSPRRRQYRADAFLAALLTARQQRGPDLILGVTNVDLYVPDLNFVFGLADAGQGCAVISLARLDPEFYGEKGDPGRFRERALKEAVHELGHLLGLPHCPNPKCIMFFSNSLADTDRKGPGFCADCRRRLGREP